ncbi:hypothetical protein PSTT_00689, partial [Puccinia striiformis]
MPLKKTAWAPWLNAIQKTSAPITHIATLDLPSTQTTELNSQSTQTTVTLQSVPATQDSSTTPDSQIDQKMINTLKDEKLNNVGTSNGFKTPSWAVVALALKGTNTAGTKAKDPGTSKTQKDFWELRGGPNTANADLMETTANNKEETQRDIGNDVLTNMGFNLGKLGDDDVEDNDDFAVVLVKSTPMPAKRKRGSALSPDLILFKLKSMSSSLSESMKAPIPSLVFAPSAPPP